MGAYVVEPTLPGSAVSDIARGCRSEYARKQLLKNQPLEGDARRICLREDKSQFYFSGCVTAQFSLSSNSEVTIVMTTLTERC